MDLDVPLGESSGKKLVVLDDYRLRVVLPTIRMCLENAAEVIIMGHLGRPEGKEIPELSVEPIYDWFWEIGEIREFIKNDKLRFLENLRFEPGEDNCDLEYAKELASLGDFFVNEAFAAYHPASSATILPKLLPHACGLHFAQEVRVLGGVRDNPKRPLVVIIGGAKVEDKLPAVLAMSKIADHVLVGGKLVGEITVTADFASSLPDNVLLGVLNEQETDLTPESISAWEKIIKEAKMIVWNGPAGWIEDSNLQNEKKLGSARGTYQLAQMIINSGAEGIVGGGDTVGFLNRLGLLGKFGFVSTGGGAMLKFLETGTLPTIEALS